MTEVTFHFNVPDKLGYACRLLRKAYAAGGPVGVVAPPDTLLKVGAQADEVVCLHAPENFQAVGQFYADFGQVEDDEVIALLSERKKP